MSKFSVERYHDISCGHRVCQHESKCQHLHGHNYRVHFKVEAEHADVSASNDQLDDIGRVLDFSVVKSRLCMWLEDYWDHKFLVWAQDPWAPQLAAIDPTVVWTPFNPTAENMAEYLVQVVAPIALGGTGCKLVACHIEETRKCTATFSL